MLVLSDIVVREPSFHMAKSKFGYKNQAHDFEDATWEWVLKRNLPREHSEDSHRHQLNLCDIEVRAWDKHDGPINPGLTQVFTPDKQGRKAANEYAKFLIREGHALMSEVVYSVRQTYDGERRLVQLQTYEVPNL